MSEKWLPINLLECTKFYCCILYNILVNAFSGRVSMTFWPAMAYKFSLFLHYIDFD